MLTTAGGLPTTMPLNELGDRKVIAEGGQGAVEAISLAADSPLVFKRFFRPEQVDVSALRASVKLARGAERRRAQPPESSRRLAACRR